MTLTFNIVCEDCERILGHWSPTEGTSPSEEEIFNSTHTGYLCEDCARSRLQEDQASEP